MEFTERYSRQVLFAPMARKVRSGWPRPGLPLLAVELPARPSASLLARAGTGYLRIVDRDYVEPSDLQRQVLFDEADEAESLPKAIAAARKIASFNSEIQVEPSSPTSLHRTSRSCSVRSTWFWMAPTISKPVI